MGRSVATCVFCTLLCVASGQLNGSSSTDDLLTILQRARSLMSKTSTTTASPTPLPTIEASTIESLVRRLAETSSEISSVTPDELSDESSTGGLTLKTPKSYSARKNDLEKRMRKLVKGWINKLIPYLRKNEIPSISGPCMSSLMTLIQGVLRLKMWAFEMLDATAKISPGILKGSMTQIGSFDQCLEVEAFTKRGKRDFQGQYCLVKLTYPSTEKAKRVSLGVPYNLTADSTIIDAYLQTENYMKFAGYRHALCVPSKCTSHDVKRIAESIVNTMGLEKMKNVDVHCKTKKGVEVGVAHIIMFCVVALLLLLLVIGTTMDVLKSRRSSQLHTEKSDNSSLLQDLVESFSLPRNAKKMMSTKTSVGDLVALHGIRFLSLAYVLYGHTYIWFSRHMLRNPTALKPWYRQVTLGIIHNAWLSVDSFIVMSGLLTAYSMLLVMEKTKGRINIIVAFVHRYLRLTPTLMFAVGAVFFLPWLADGPFWDDVAGRDVRNCQQSWWTLLFYFHNFFPFEKLCLQHSWYAQCDMQLYIVAVFILLVLYRSRLVGFLLMSIAVLASWISVGIITQKYNFLPTVMFSIPDLELIYQTLSLIHIRPYTHLAPYCVGMVTGYLLVKHRHIHLEPVVQVIGWCLSTAFALASLLGIHQWDIGAFPPQALASLYAALHRTSWSLSIAWVMFVCVTGNGGPVNALLSSKFFIPLSRLTFCGYLIHPHLLWTRYGWARDKLTVTHFTGVYYFIAQIVLVILLAGVLHLLVEAPISAVLRKLMFRYGMTKEQKELYLKAMAEKTTPVEDGPNKKSVDTPASPNSVVLTNFTSGGVVLTGVAANGKT